MNILCVMDPVEKLNTRWDNSLFILSELHAAGHACWCADSGDLIPSPGALHVRAARLAPDFKKRRNGRVKRNFRLSKALIRPIQSFDLVLIRKEPPVDEKFVTMTLLLERFADKVPMVNHPRGIRNTNEKLSAFQFPRHSAPAILSSSPDEILEFRKKIGGDIVVKPLNMKGGKDVFRIQASNPAAQRLLERLTRAGRRVLIAQEFIKAKRPVEKRIVLLNGKVLTAYEKRPRAGEFRGNLDLGASFHPTKLTAGEKRIVRDIRGYLLANGLYFVGIDVLNEKLLEINVTCPAGVTEAKFLQPDLRPERAWVSFLEDFVRGSQ